jgi:hypothetical protein
MRRETLVRWRRGFLRVGMKACCGAHHLGRASATHGHNVRLMSSGYVQPELGRQQMPAAEHVKRKVAVAIIVAVEEAAFLMAVERVVRGVEVEDHLLGWTVLRLQEQVTNGASIAAGSCAILRYFVGVSRDSSNGFSVDLPAAGAQSSRQALSLPASTAISGS